MTLYRYTFGIDGQEVALRPETHDDREAAIARGRVLLIAGVEVDGPQAAFVAIAADLGEGDSRLGAWDWSTEAPEPMWTAGDRR